MLPPQGAPDVKLLTWVTSCGHTFARALRARDRQGQGGCVRIVRDPAPGIPQGCEKVARGKRSAAPGIVRKRGPRPGRTPDKQMGLSRKVLRPSGRKGVPTNV